MCGIAGFFTPGRSVQEALLTDMAASLSHRGPDQSGVWCNQASGIGFAHARLSILDLTPNGKQPMTSPDGRFTICYNGEVFNHLDIRTEIGDYAFKSHCDTETILAAVSRWGIHKSLDKFIGMFAFALWDNVTQKLFLVRDRLGIKPLYYGRMGNGWLFGSELKALRCHPSYSPSISRDALTLFFRYNYVPSPYCIFQDTLKVAPGQMVTIDASGVERHQWWSARSVWQAGIDSPYTGSAQAGVNALETLLLDAVARRMLSDVPIGAFLSGGIDSSTVVALMQAQSATKVNTFTIGFHEKGYNEAEHARAIAEHLGTNHTEVYVTSQDMLSVVPNIPTYWDEPFSDSSQFPTYILSKLTREHVTVSLSGDGGDELFCGYPRYFAMNYWDKISRIPLPMRHAAASVLGMIPPKLFNAFGAIGPKIQWRLNILTMTEFSEFYRFFISHEQSPESLVLGGHEPLSAITLKDNTITQDRKSQMAFWDIISYLPDDILTKIDRASMAVSLEARVPLLDHRVVEFAAALPTGFKVRDGQSKWLLRQVLHKYVPQHLIDRPKMGFGVPVQEWLRGDLKEWCLDTLNLSSIRQQGFLNSKRVERMLTRFYKGEGMWCHNIWDILMFQSWYNKWR